MTAERRRQYGTGAIYQRSSDGRWIGEIQAGWTARGTRRRITVSVSPNHPNPEAECKKRLQRKVNQIAKEGLPLEGAQTRTAVKAWAEVWLERQQRELRPKTWTTHNSQVRKWIIPTIGNKRLDTLTPGDVRATTDAVRKAGLSSSTALRVHILLTQILGAAINEGHQIPIRVIRVKPPRRAVGDRDALEYEHAIAVLRTAAEKPDASRWVAALLQGMRQGECLGLTWDAVDLTHGTIDVSWQLQALPYKHGCDPQCDARAQECKQRRLRVPDGYEYRQLDGALCLVRPKSKAGHRVIPLVPWMTTALAKWQTIAPQSPHGLVWPRPDGRPGDVEDDRAAWKALQTEAKVSGPDRPYHLHEARHTTATLLLAEGADPKIVTAIMGHSSIAVSQLYQHVSQDMARKALDGVAKRLELA